MIAWRTSRVILLATPLFRSDPGRLPRGRGADPHRRTVSRPHRLRAPLRPGNCAFVVAAHEVGPTHATSHALYLLAESVDFHVTGTASGGRLETEARNVTIDETEKPDEDNLRQPEGHTPVIIGENIEWLAEDILVHDMIRVTKTDERCNCSVSCVAGDVAARTPADRRGSGDGKDNRDNRPASRNR